jgi:DNA-directed RNA polymerase sigma subunit (sigma70/sigma32)
VFELLWSEARGPDLQRARTAKNKLVTANLGLVVSVASRFQNRGIDFEDLVSAGTIGLMRAIDLFDPDRGCTFATYAHHWLLQAIAREIHDHSALVRRPARISHVRSRIERARAALRARHGRDPSAQEIAQETRLTVERVEAALMPTFCASLDVRLGDDAEGNAVVDILPSNDPGPEAATLDRERRRLASQALAAVDDRELAVLEARVRDRTLADVGNDLAMSREHARRLELRAVTRMRRQLIRGADLVTGG